MQVGNVNKQYFIVAPHQRLSLMPLRDLLRYYLKHSSASLRRVHMAYYAVPGEQNLIVARRIDKGWDLENFLPAERMGTHSKDIGS